MSTQDNNKEDNTKIYGPLLIFTVFVVKMAYVKPNMYPICKGN